MDDAGTSSTSSGGSSTGAEAAVARTFTEGAAESPGSKIVGSAPILIEECEIVAVAQGWEGFEASPHG